MCVCAFFSGRRSFSNWQCTLHSASVISSAETVADMLEAALEPAELILS
jgi:hypothetical protein